MNSPFQEDKIISDFLKSIGPWRDYVVIGGGFALFIYTLYLTRSTITNYPIATRDIDSLIPRKIPVISQKNLSNHLKEAGFQPLFKDVEIPATQSYVKEIDGVEVEIEFLTDTSTRGDKIKNVEIAGVIAQPLNYLTLSLKNRQEFQTFSQEKGFVVAPSVWIFHKGLTFIKRKSSLKKLKDLYGIWFVITQMGNLSQKVVIDFQQVVQNESKWFETFKKNLVTWIENASPSEWSMLEMQDPTGRLKKLNFQRAINQLLVNS